MCFSVCLRCVWYRWFVCVYGCLGCYGVVYCLLIVLLLAGLVYILARFICFGCDWLPLCFSMVGLFIVD